MDTHSIQNSPLPTENEGLFWKGLGVTLAREYFGLIDSLNGTYMHIQEESNALT